MRVVVRQGFYCTGYETLLNKTCDNEVRAVATEIEVVTLCNIE